MVKAIVIGGVLFVGLGLALIAGIFYFYFKNHPEARKRVFARLGGLQVADDPTIGDRPVSEPGVHRRKLGKLEQVLAARPGNVILFYRLGYEFHVQKTVQAVAAVHLMTQAKMDASLTWKPAGSVGQVSAIDGAWLWRLPKREQGRFATFLMNDADLPGIVRFLLGSSSSPGPARRFAHSNQTDPQSFALSDLKQPPAVESELLDATWETLDLGAIWIQESQGARPNGALDSGDMVFEDDLYQTCTCRQVGGDRYLLVLFPREGCLRSNGGTFPTRGVGGAFIGGIVREQDIEQVI